MVLALRQLVGGQNNMLRNKIISIVALAVIGPASPTGAFARGGGGGRGFGFFGPYAYGDYPYYYGDDDEGGCYLVARRVLTRYGWRSRRVEICD
jgi:hypothetical protein